MRTPLASAVVFLLFYGATTVDVPAKPYPEPSLIFSTLTEIRNMHLDGTNATIVRRLHGCLGVDYLYRADVLFWSDFEGKRIIIDVDNGNILELKGDVNGPQNIAVDWIYHNLYWVDYNKNTLEVANFNGYRRQVLIKDMHQPIGIALAPMNGWLFWTNSNTSLPSIEKAGMDGTQRRIIVSKNIKRPIGLTIDLAGGHLYWNDEDLFTISSSDYNGNDVRQILHSPEALKYPSGIEIFEDWVFWASKHKVSNVSIFKYNIVKKGGMKSLFTRGSSVQVPTMFMRIYHKTKQPDGENHCLNVHCSHLCVPAPMVNASSPKFSCICPENFHIYSDGLTCVQEGAEPKLFPEPSLIFSTGKEIRNMHLDGTYATIVRRPKGCFGVDYLYKAHILFWTDVETKRIIIDAENGTVIELKGGVSAPKNIAVDWIYHNLYWVDFNKNTLEVANGYRRQVLIRYLDEPIGIALDPMKGWMFWTNSHTSSAGVEKAGMDGSHRGYIVKSDVIKSPYGLTIDLAKERLYFNDRILSTISECDYNGNGLRLIYYSVETLKHPSGIEFFEDWLFWASEYKKSIFKLNIVKHDGVVKSLFTAGSSLQAPQGMRIYHKTKQPDGENHCLNANCTHLCVPAPKMNDSSPKFSCICPENFVLYRDGITCLPEGSPLHTVENKKCPQNGYWISCKNPCRKVCDREPPATSCHVSTDCFPILPGGDCQCSSGYAESPYKPWRCIPILNTTTIIKCEPYIKRHIHCPPNSYFTRCKDPCRRICGKKVILPELCLCDFDNVLNQGCQCHDGYFEGPYPGEFECIKPRNEICYLEENYPYPYRPPGEPYLQ